jgi:hypothetical protein
MALEECLAPHAEMRAPKGLRGGAGLAEICYLPRKCLSIDSEVIDGTTLIVRIESRAEAAACAWIYWTVLWSSIPLFVEDDEGGAGGGERGRNAADRGRYAVSGPGVS